MLTDAEVLKLAEPIFATILGPLGFSRASVVSGADQDGDKAFFIEAFFEPGSNIVNGKALVEARGQLHDALTALGEERFPYVSYRLPGEPEPYSDDLDEPASPHP
ncbi:hypothetical protein [Methylobacterium sp. J-068]|uniref:hypothetical protein n=1 Tax=Methylobacterium sp. J-068 TaxID=2836649 RepID=UPI001FBA7D36|nr:hypothetical protein [Methylobacterium sp. J-068]MCJ2035424.1 hypothetical protein [Methylobacterium sp. J-068]